MLCYEFHIDSIRILKIVKNKLGENYSLEENAHCNKNIRTNFQEKRYIILFKFHILQTIKNDHIIHLQ
jgi:hypothetical protein